MANGLILRNILLFLSGLFISLLHGEETSAPSPQQGKVVIESPQQDAVLKKSDVDVFIRVDGDSIPAEKNRFHVFLDRESFILHEDSRRPVVLKNLSAGGHIIRVVAIQPNGLALPLPDSFAAVRFFVKKKDFKNYADLNRPYITVNLPANGMVAPDSEQRICFDFLVHNATLNEKDGYKVRYLLNTRKEILHKVEPIYWSDLPMGKHSLVVELLDASDNPVLGLLSRVERQFEIAPVVKPLPMPGSDDTDELPTEDN